jgi:hypothetical protein
MSRAVLFGTIVTVAIAWATVKADARENAQAALPAQSEPTARPAAASEPSASLQSDAERESFLLEAAVVKHKSAPGGITGSIRATLRRGAFVHDAHIQQIDEAKSQNQLSSGTEFDFRDSFRNNVAAYRLDRMLGLGMVPVTAMRSFEQRSASYTWWVDDVLMDEKKRLREKIPSPDTAAWNDQMFVVRIFDQLIYNTDRNLGNLLIDKEWRIWMIDHSRAFKIFKKTRERKELGPRCERRLLAALRRLDQVTLRETMKGLLNPGQISGLLARRDEIVQHYDERIAALGEADVLYDLSPRLSGAEPPR